MGSSCSLHSKNSSETDDQFNITRNLPEDDIVDGTPQVSSLRHAVVRKVPNRYIPSFFPKDENYVVHSDGTKSPKPLAVLATEQLCRSLVYANGPLPANLPPDVIYAILDCLHCHRALNAKTLSMFCNNELPDLQLDECRGVTDEWLQQLIHGSYEESSCAHSMEVDHSPNLSSTSEGSNMSALLDSPLLLGSRHLLEIDDGLIEKTEAYRISRVMNHSDSSTSFLTASEAETPPPIPVVPLISSSYCANSSSSVVGSIDENELMDVDVQESCQDKLPSPCTFQSIATYAKTSPTCTIRSLNLSKAQFITDNGLLQLGELPLLEFASLNQCHSIQGGGLKVLSQSFHLKNLSMQDCRSLEDEGLELLTHLSALESINLSGCRSLTTSTMVSLGKRFNLKHLNISKCDKMVTDTSVVGLRFLQQLEDFNASFCFGLSSEGLEEFAMHRGRSMKLQSLNISRCDVDDPTCLIHLKSLESLNMSGCKSVESSRLCRALKELPRLRKLDVSFIPGILRSSNWEEALRNISELAAGHSNVRDNHVAKLLSLRMLKSLDLDSCPIGDWSIAHLVRNQVTPNLCELNLADTNVSDAAMKNIEKLHQLRKLSLFYCKISDNGLQRLGGLKSLEELSVDSREITDNGIRFLKRLPTLKRLDLFSCKISNDGCHTISRLSSLEHLEICGGGVSDAGCQSLSLLQRLKVLNLSQNDRITNRGAGYLAMLTNLKSLNLSNTSVTSSMLRHLVGLKNLRTLTCYGCKPMIGPRMEWFKIRLPQLRCLRVDSVPPEEGTVLEIPGMHDDNLSWD